MTVPRVALVVTGRLEFRALADAMRTLFPRDVAEFVVAPTLEEGELVDSTSTRVDPTRNALAASRGAIPAIDDLVGHLAGCLSGRGASDFALLVEDLELLNRGNEFTVIAAVREAVGRHLVATARRPGAPADLATRLRDRASFHLFDPMVEAYFYDDPVALSVAQSELGRPAFRVRSRDVERFEVDAAADGGFFAPVGECLLHRKPRDRRCSWDGELRAEHPKKYLKYLCRMAPPNEFCTTYQETRGGASALRVLDWNRVLSTPGNAPFLRAMIEDIEAAVGVRPALSEWPASPTSNAITARANAPRSLALRNL